MPLTNRWRSRVASVDTTEFGSVQIRFGRRQEQASERVHRLAKCPEFHHTDRAGTGFDRPRIPALTITELEFAWDQIAAGI
jgi:hypothetical protein